MRPYFYISSLVYGAVVSAHFQLQFPPPRGAFVANNQPTFCDGYNTVSTNRTQFPLTNGFFTINSEHLTWTSGVILSTAANPTSFNNFSQVKSFFQLRGEGAFCIPLDLASNANATNLRDGQNVTIQIIFDGGDGALYQCADVTLSSSLQIPSTVSCTNATTTTSTGTAAASTPSKAGAIGRNHTMGYGGLIFSLIIIVLSIL